MKPSKKKWKQCSINPKSKIDMKIKKNHKKYIESPEGTIRIEFAENHFSENDARQRKYMHVFLLITIIAVVESLFYFAYSPIVSNKIINLYPRFIIENFSNLLWDVPVIIIMTVSHY